MNIETFEHNGFSVEINYDEYASSPREWDNAGRMNLRHRDYRFPNDDGIDFDAVDEDYNDKFPTAKALAAHLVAEYDAHPDLILLVQFTEHGPQVQLRTTNLLGEDRELGSYNIGLVYMTKATFEDEWVKYYPIENDNGTLMTATDAALKALASEVEEYGRYVNGECYSYTIKDFDGEIVDSCAGFIGDTDYVEAEARSAADALERVKKCTGFLDRLTGTVEHGETCPIHVEVTA